MVQGLTHEGLGSKLHSSQLPVQLFAFLQPSITSILQELHAYSTPSQ